MKTSRIMFDGVEVSYTVFPSACRFTGNYALTQASSWARKLKAATPGQRVVIKNEMGSVVGTL